MNLFPLILLGNPILRNKSAEVTPEKIALRSFQLFLDKLAATCLKENGVGIAAPQVGKNIRVIVVHVDPKNPRYLGKKPFPLTIVINPVVTKRSKKEKEDWEGDLSVDLRGLVSRPVTCVVTGLDRKGKEITFDLQDDFHARVFQHEIDHLDGIMFLDKVEKKESLSTYAMWKKYWKGKNRD
jgi:peptide deformylase